MFIFGSRSQVSWGIDPGRFGGGLSPIAFMPMEKVGNDHLWNPRQLKPAWYYVCWCVGIGLVLYGLLCSFIIIFSPVSRFVRFALDFFSRVRVDVECVGCVSRVANAGLAVAHHSKARSLVNALFNVERWWHGTSHARSALEFHKVRRSSSLDCIASHGITLRANQYSMRRTDHELPRITSGR